MKKTTKTLFVVVNGFHAVMMRNSGTSVHPKIETIWSTEMETGAELRPRDHRPGRVYESMGNRRSAYEARDVVGHQRKIFLEKVLAKIAETRKSEEFETVMLSASPSALGVLRSLMPHDLEDAIDLQVTKDYTKLPPVAAQSRILRYVL
jgi:protein required for attachment to host cells